MKVHKASGTLAATSNECFLAQLEFIAEYTKPEKYLDQTSLEAVYLLTCEMCVAPHVQHSQP